jgi:hypothetical protein
MLSQADIDAFTTGEAPDGGRAAADPGQPNPSADPANRAAGFSGPAPWALPRVPAVQPWFPLWWLRYPTSSDPGG